MCGICGIWNYKNFSPVDHRLIDRMSASLVHRGPDDQGQSFDDDAGVGFGFRRLSILDLSKRGHQPMKFQQLTIVYNGEVYNFNEIRNELEKGNYTFDSTSDTEVILKAFHAWGIKAVDKFIGMFAFAIWDSLQKKMFLFRDRLGVKPLYYGKTRDSFWFGSELKVLRTIQKENPEINQQALGEYFHYGYISAPRSIFKNVWQLRPGHWLEVTQSGINENQYWSVIDSLDKPLHDNEELLCEELENLLINAFKYRLVSDVPVGIFLSGGIDSSLVAAILRKHTNQNIKTFTIGFKEEEYDESRYARKIADHLETDHTEYVVGIDDVKDLVPNWHKLYDEPFADSSGLPTHIVSKLARKNVTVALSADGGDELFCGYDSYYVTLNRLNLLRKIPMSLRYILAGILRNIPLHDVRWFLRKFPQYGGDRLSDRLIRLGHALPNINPAILFDLGKSQWFSEDIQDLIGAYDRPQTLMNHYPGNTVEQMMLQDLHHYLPNDILTKVDRVSMAVSLEAREPLLDHRIVEFAFRLPLKYRMGKLGSKHLLRKILYKYIDKEGMERPKKGFSIPITKWLRNDLSYLVDDYLNPEVIKRQNVLNPLVVKRFRKSFRSGCIKDDFRLWQLLAFQIWFTNNSWK